MIQPITDAQIAALVAAARQLPPLDPAVLVDAYSGQDFVRAAQAYAVLHARGLTILPGIRSQEAVTTALTAHAGTDAELAAFIRDCYAENRISGRI